MGIYGTGSESGRYENLDPDPDQKRPALQHWYAQHFSNFTLIFRKFTILKLLNVKRLRMLSLLNINIRFRFYFVRFFLLFLVFVSFSFRFDFL
jgi:hypothetical protein